MALDVGAVFIPVLPNLGGFAPAMQKGLGGVVSGLSAANIAASAGAVALAAFAAAGVKAALDFDRSFTKIAAISNTSAGAIEGMKSQVLALAGETAKAPTELADALFFLASAGLDASEVMPALEASAKASAVGLGETADVANIVASALNAYSSSGLTAAEVTDTLVAAVREGRAEPEEFANALGRILPIASSVGVSFDQLAASMAVLSNIGLDVNEGVTAMRGVLQAIAAPGTQAAEAMKKLGLSAQDLLNSISEDGILGALRLLDQRAREATSGQAAYFGVLRKVIPNVRALTGALGITGQEAEKVDAIFQRVLDSTGDTGEAFRTTAQSDAFQFQKALNDITIAGQELGTALLPVLTDLVEILKPAADLVADIAKAFAFQASGFEGYTTKLREVVNAYADGEISILQYEEALKGLRDQFGFTFTATDNYLPALEEATQLHEENAGRVALHAARLEGLGKTVTDTGGKISRFGGMSKEAFAEFQQGLEDAVNVAVGEFETLNDAFDQTPAELEKALDLAVQIAKRENRALREIFASKDLSDAQKEALAALPANMRDAWLQAGKAGRAQIAKDAVALARANAAAVNTAVNAARNATGGMVAVGQSLMQGVIAGVTDYIPSLYNTIDNAINGAIARARAAAQAASPSKKMFKLGLDLMTGLQNGITENEQKVIDAAQKVIDKAIAAMTKDLEKLQAALDKVMSKASEFRDSIRGGFDRFLDISGAFTQQVSAAEHLALVIAEFGEASTEAAEARKALLETPDALFTAPATGESIAQFFASQLRGAQVLAELLKNLKGRGAGKELLAQVAQGGPEAITFGQTLLQQGPEAITAINDSLKAIADLGGGTAEGLTNKFFGEKIDDLRGDVKELTKNLRVLEKPQRLLVEFRGGDANALRQYILEVLASSSLARQPL